jgi:hypothetical protein
VIPNTATDLPQSPNDAATRLLGQLRDINAANALIAANAMTPIVERLAIEGASTPDVDLARKTLESLQKVAVHPEKQESAKATAGAATAFFNIILDRSVKQVPPPADPDRPRRAVPSSVEDAVLVRATATHALESDAPWGESLDD